MVQTIRTEEDSQIALKMDTILVNPVKGLQTNRHKSPCQTAMSNQGLLICSRARAQILFATAAFYLAGFFFQLKLLQPDVTCRFLPGEK